MFSQHLCGEHQHPIPPGLCCEILRPHTIKERRYSPLTTTFLCGAEGDSQDEVPASTVTLVVRLHPQRSRSCPCFFEVDNTKAEQHSPPQRQQLQQGSGQPTTVQILSLDPQVSMWTLVAFLDHAGYYGEYNYVYIPHSMEGWSKEYAFVNFVSAASARSFFKAWHGCMAPGIAKQAAPLSCKLASHQGYEHYASAKKMKEIRRLRNRDMWPLIATPDGCRLLMAPWFRRRK
mmetsp:Transcript_16588/g.38851  ORF Transcript_16588/g.38851 Transcript_16588/m.38851 type:complete len:232 (-) Transcript_16588:548-1243(-)